MSTGTLRRHYRQASGASNAPAAARPVVEQPEGIEAGSGDATEPPARSAKTADWVAYAEANPTDPPIDLTERKGLRDEIAAHYLGEG